MIDKAALRAEIETVAIRNPKWGRGRIYRELRRRHGDVLPIKERAVGNWIAQVRAAAKDGKGIDGPDAWQPWVNGPVGAARPSYLLALDAIARVVRQQLPLQRHEACWATRIELDLVALQPFGQWFLVEEYGKREKDASKRGNKEPHTGDLDTLLLLKPWTEDGRVRYRHALETGAAAIPYIEGLIVPLERGEEVGGLTVLSYLGWSQLGTPFNITYTEPGQSTVRVASYELPEEAKPAKRLIEMNWADVLLEYWEWLSSGGASFDGKETR